MEENSDSFSEAEIEDVEFVEAPSVNTSDTQERMIMRQFISKMKSMPLLWDSSCPDYGNSMIRQKALMKLVAIYKQIKPHATLYDVRKKINSLRSNYRKEFKKIEKSRQTAECEEDVYKPRSWLFYKMQFLNRIFKKDATSDISSTLLEPEENQSRTFRKRFKTVSVSMAKKNSLIKPRDSQSSDRFSRAGSIPHSDTTSFQNTTTHTYEPTQSSSTPQSFNTSSNTISPVALYWSHKLDCIKDPTQKLYAEKYINEILFEAQQGNLAGSPTIGVVSGMDGNQSNGSHTTESVNKNESLVVQEISYSP